MSSDDAVFDGLEELGRDYWRYVEIAGLVDITAALREAAAPVAPVAPATDLPLSLQSLTLS